MDCPGIPRAAWEPPEYHVAASRSWRERHGAQLVGMSADVLNIETIDGPRSRDDALALAREQYVYCGDLVNQETYTLSDLAAGLIANPWWCFWWD